MINLSRNSPVAFLVGGAGFIGSHLCELFLSKNIQVVVVDDFSSGRRENLLEAGKNKNFHLINSPNLDQELPRLDYAVFTITEDINRFEYKTTLNSFLKLVGQYHPKALMVSSIELYGKRGKLPNLEDAERELARLAEERHLNVRILRLAPVFGKRMNFRQDEPIFKLIKATAANQLKYVNFPLDFTTRSLTIEDAIDLLMKALMHGATSQKIYDGALPCPLKIGEIKQLLEDPLWYENKGFEPTKLPPWPTPNLVKTQKELSWTPKMAIAKTLKESIRYVSERPELFRGNEPEEMAGEKAVVEETKKESHPQEKPNIKPKFKIELGKYKKFILPLLAIALLTWAFLVPVGYLAFQIISTRDHISSSLQFLETGNYKVASQEIGLAKSSSLEIEKILQLPFVPQSWQEISTNLYQTVVVTAEIIGATENLEQTIETLAGSNNNNLLESIDRASGNLQDADKKIQVLSQKLADLDVGLGQSSVDKWKNLLGLLARVVKGEKLVAFIVPQLGTGEKRYLLTLADNRQLRPGGGVLSSYALVETRDGKFKSVLAGKVGELDQKLSGVTPPADLAADTGITSWSLRDSSYELDFPTVARWSRSFFSKETGVIPAGVISLDFTALAKIYNSTANQSITADDLDQKGPEALKAAANRLFFLPNGNWISSMELLSGLVTQKHLQLKLEGQNASAYLLSEGWSGSLPKVSPDKTGERSEFLALAESNIGQDKVNPMIKRVILMADKVAEDGMVTHTLSVSYGNQNPPSADGGSYKFRLKIYLQPGAKLTNVSWAGADVSSSVRAFSDFGLAGYSTVLELGPGEQKRFILEYGDSKPLELGGNPLVYKVNFFKQPGTDSDQLNFKLNIPASWQIDGVKPLDSQKSLTLDTSVDRSLTFKLSRTN